MTRPGWLVVAIAIAIIIGIVAGSWFFGILTGPTPVAPLG